jgi:hypothetical protein
MGDNSHNCPKRREGDLFAVVVVGDGDSAPWRCIIRVDELDAMGFLVVCP